MTNSDSADSLKPKQEAAIAALLLSGSVVKAAEKAGVGRRTLFRWLKEPSFRAAYDAARHQSMALGLGVIQDALAEAARTLRDKLTSEQEKIQVAAANGLLRVGVKANEQLDIMVELAELRETIRGLCKGTPGVGEAGGHGDSPPQ